MMVEVRENKVHDFKVMVPPSKSYMHRCLITACLIRGKSYLYDCCFNNDTTATMNALRKLGAVIEVDGTNVIVDGTNFLKIDEEVVLDCNESGSTLRFLIPLSSNLKQGVTLIGTKKLMSRPLTIYEELYKESGSSFELYEKELKICGNLKKNVYEIDGSISSQFITGLIFDAIYKQEKTTIEIVGTFESSLYVTMTVNVLQQAGFDICMKDRLIVIKPKVVERFSISVEKDDSSVAFFAVLAAMKRVKCECIGVKKETSQGDHVIFDLLKQMGNDVFVNECGNMVVQGKKMHAITIDLANCIDLGPILIALASTIQEKTTFIHTRRLRMKESDRIDAMQDALCALGVCMNVYEDRVEISGKNELVGGICLKGYNDHRIVMALAILSSCCKKGNTITDANAICKSYPQFFEDLRISGMEVI